MISIYRVFLCGQKEDGVKVCRNAGGSNLPKKEAKASLF